jgi:prepilin peptidase CpaA
MVSNSVLYWSNQITHMEDSISPLLFGILFIAAIFDVKYRKIPNMVTIPTIIAGLAYHSWFNGIEGFLHSTGGTLLGMAFLIVFYLAGKMGAGDVKLLGAAGSILGPAGVFKAFVFTAMIGGIYAIIILVISRHFLDLIGRTWQSMKLSLLIRSPVAPTERKATPVICYGIAIALGTSLSMVF